MTSPAKPPAPAGAESSQRIVRSAASPPSEPLKRAAAQKPSRHATHERRLLFAGGSALPRYPTRPRHYYPGAPVTDPGSDGPPYAPQWYERYPAPRGPW